jgi:CheY-like chemotaxis protein
MNTASRISRWWCAGGEGDPVSWNIYGLRLVVPQQSPVLIVDDDPDQLRILHSMVANAGFAVTSVDSVDEALLHLQERPFSVIVADYKMPEMSGLDFIKVARTLEVEWDLNAVPVVILTACGEDIEFQSIEQGADMFCEKFRAGNQLIKQLRFLLEM